MKNTSSILTEKVVNSAINSLRKKKRIELLSFAAIAKELDVGIDELSSFYTTTEDIFLKAQKKDWESLHRYWDKQIKKAKTPGDYMRAFEIFFERFVETLSKDSDLRFELSCYLPACVKFRDKNRIKVKEKFTKLIKRGWPGKDEKVIQRQSELVTVLFYGFIDHVVHIPKNERLKILSDFRNMLNLHLQDRKFFKMNVDVQKKVKIIQKSMDSIRKMDKTVHTISFIQLAHEMEMPLNELTDFFLDVEDIFLNEQKRVTRKIEAHLEKGIKNCKTPNDAKDLMESSVLKMVDLLPDYSDLVYSAIFYLPKCLAERDRTKKYYRQKIRIIIKKGWPGKIDSVLDRQANLVLLSLYGFLDYCVKANKRERKEVLKDFNNMINLHLQDRLFF